METRRQDGVCFVEWGTEWGANSSRRACKEWRWEDDIGVTIDKITMGMGIPTPCCGNCFFFEKDGENES